MVLNSNISRITHMLILCLQNSVTLYNEWILFYITAGIEDYEVSTQCGDGLLPLKCIFCNFFILSFYTLHPIILISIGRTDYANFKFMLIHDPRPMIINLYRVKWMTANWRMKCQLLPDIPVMSSCSEWYKYNCNFGIRIF